VATVLIVEPDPEVEALFARVLRGAGHEVVLFRPGAEAPPGRLVLVLEPTDEDALALARELLSRRGEEVAVVCASIQPQRHVRGVAPCDWLVKPFRLAELVQAVAAAAART
jgi:DNA-binding response OmpR family regulator